METSKIYAAQFALKIKFSGLCAFVPSKKTRKAWVLLIDQKKTFKEVAYLRKNSGVPLHSGVVKFFLKNIEGIAVDDTARGVWLAEGYDIHIRPGGVESSCHKLDFEDFDPKVDRAIGAVPKARSFAWVAPVEEACAGRYFSGCGQIYPELLEAPLPSHFKDVVLAARVHLEEGRLETNQVSHFEGKKVVWRFRPFEGNEGQRDHRQLLASEVSVRIEIESDFVELVALSLGKEGEKQVEKGRLKLRPTSKQIEMARALKELPQVEIQIMNEEAEEILEIETTNVLNPKQPRVQDRIFEDLLILSPNAPAPSEVPIPVAEYFVGGGPGDGTALGSPPCSPARMAAVDI